MKQVGETTARQMLQGLRQLLQLILINLAQDDKDSVKLYLFLIRLSIHANGIVIDSLLIALSLPLSRSLCAVKLKTMDTCFKMLRPRKTLVKGKINFNLTSRYVHEPKTAVNRYT